MKNEFVVRRAESITDYVACQNAQRLAWGLTEESYVVPIATMVGAQLHGGLVLGAFRADGTAVGVSFAFLGRADGRLCLYSQLTGVVPGYQDQGIGGRLKAAQRMIARQENVPCIAWAFDPLQAGNAHFNLEKLGATVGRYIENMYGLRSDRLNRNATTDRLIAVWETDETTARPVADNSGNLPRVIRTDGGPSYSGLPDVPGFLIEVPLEINRLRVESADVAEQWAMAVRQAFLGAFASGYRGVGFLREEGRAFYRLARPASGSDLKGEAVQSS